jgi:hypothetical protein
MGLRLLALALLVLGSAPLAGCRMPSGTPVIVERRTGKAWSGNGVLLEVSEDREHCRVALRGQSLFVEERWVPCRYVHARSSHY